MIRTFNQIDIKSKKVLVRCDFNVPFDDNGKISDDFRIKSTLPTIKYLLENDAKIILMSHLGDPKGIEDSALKMDPIIARLQEYLDMPIAEISGWDFGNIRASAENMKEKEIILLENLRFHPGEESNDEEFAKNLSSLGDAYVNDAFGTSHREHASIVGVPKYLPSVAGLLLQKEIEVLGGILHAPARPLVAIMGGAKVATKIKLMEKLLDVADHILIGGIMANTILKAKGAALGKSKVDEAVAKGLESFNLTDNKVHLPIDVVTSADLTGEHPSFIRGVGGVSDDEFVLDIGPDTRKLFTQVINRAGTIFWNGPMGLFEIEKFSRGTETLARAIAESDCFSVVGGGDVVVMFDKLGLTDKIDHISTGGGAMLQFMTGEKLPGIEALSQP